MSLGIDSGVTGIKYVRHSSIADGAAYTAVTGEWHEPTPHDQTELVMRVGSRVPYVYAPGVDALDAHELYANQIGQVLTPRPETELVDARGRSRERLEASSVVAVPGWWSSRAMRLTAASLARNGHQHAELVPTPVLAAIGARMHGPESIAVVDSGAGVTSTAVVDSGQRGFSLHDGSVSSVRKGGDYVDRQILRHLLGSLADPELLNPDKPDSVEHARHSLGLARFAKESLSDETAVTVSWSAAAGSPSVRLVRAELNELCRPWIDQILAMLRISLAEATSPVTTVLLVGGSVKMPAIAQRISAELGLAVVVDDDPELTTVKGGADRAAQTAQSQGRAKPWSRWFQRRRTRHRNFVPATQHSPMHSEQDSSHGSTSDASGSDSTTNDSVGSGGSTTNDSVGSGGSTSSDSTSGGSTSTAMQNAAGSAGAGRHDNVRISRRDDDAPRVAAFGKPSVGSPEPERTAQ